LKRFIRASIIIFDHHDSAFILHIYDSSQETEPRYAETFAVGRRVEITSRRAETFQGRQFCEALRWTRF